MKTTILTLCGGMIFLLSPSMAQDVVHLKNGATMEGKLVDTTPTTILLEFQGGSVEIAKTMVDRIDRGQAPTVEQKEERALLTLSRFAEEETHYFLYRQGRRVGFRTVKLVKTSREGIPGYLLTDRMVFLPNPGAPLEAEAVREEFVDAEMRPLSVRYRQSSGMSTWELKGVREGNELRIAEIAAGKSSERVALMRPEVEVSGMMLRRLVKDTVPTGGYRPFTVFDPKSATFTSVAVQRLSDKLALRGKSRDVIIMRRRQGGMVLDTWFDMAGRVVREQMGTPFLEAIRAPETEITAYVRGEESAGEEDLGLEYVSEETGLRMLRPDVAWEFDHADEGERRLVSFLRPSYQATVDVFRLDGFTPGVTLEGIALDVFQKMQREVDSFHAEPPVRGLVGTLLALRFRASCRKGDKVLTTIGAVMKEDDQVFLILCAAPEKRFKLALPGFRAVLDSVRLRSLEQTSDGPVDPFADPTPKKRKKH